MLLIATRPLRYASRAFAVGDRFEARSELDAKLLVYAAKKARFADSPTSVPPLTQSDMDIERLRMKAERLGITVDKRWGAKRLQSEIDSVQGAAF